MAKGTVKWFNKEKGYGFIQPEEGGADVFVHVSQLHEAGLQTLSENQAVEYELIEGIDNRKMAGSIKADGAEAAAPPSDDEA